jgi:hypothetical protein
MSASEPAQRWAPGLSTTAHTTVAPYPAAAVLTSWFNAFSAGQIAAAVPAPGISPDEPVMTTEADVAGWLHSRIPLGVALASITWPVPATAALPVPGDVGGIPPGCQRALAAGEAMVLGGQDRSLLFVPSVLPGGNRLWHAVSAGAVSPPPVDIGALRRQIMSALEEAVTVAEDAVFPLRAKAGAATRAVQDTAVPLPPGSPAEIVSLASQSAVLVTLADELLRDADTSDVAGIGAQIRTLGRLGRHGLAVAFSATGRG